MKAIQIKIGNNVRLIGIEAVFLKIRNRIFSFLEGMLRSLNSDVCTKNNSLKKIGTLKSLIKRKDARISLLGNKIETLSDRINAKNNSLKKIGTLKSLIKRKDARISLLGNKIETLSDRINAKNNSLKKIGTLKSLIKRKDARISLLGNKIETLSDRINAKNNSLKKIGTLKSLIKRKDARISLLGNKIETLSDRINAKNNSLKKIGTLKSLIKRKDARISLLGNKIETLSDRINAKNNSLKKIDALKNMIKRKDARIKLLGNKIETLSKRINIKNNIKNNSLKKIDALKDVIKRKDTTIKLLRSKIRTLTDRVHAKNESLKVKNEIIHSYRKRIEERLKNKTGLSLQWMSGDDLSKTSNWENSETINYKLPPVKRSRLKVLFLNSMGGSMSRLSRALMLYENIEADCYVAAYSPRKHLVYSHETNVFGLFTHQEWRDFLGWAINFYDIIQSSTFPLSPYVGECYDWLTDKIGNRHVWRTTGFIHHYIHREDILPLKYYQNDLKTNNIPNKERFTLNTFRIDDRYVFTDHHTVFYSSPEKGAYLSGKSNYWLPSIRDPEDFSFEGFSAKKTQDKIKVYVPYHKAAMWKGLDLVIKSIQEIIDSGYPVDLITSENAGAYFPELCVNSSDKNQSIYPIPNYMMPILLNNVDVVIDQIIMGSYGNTGIEAMMAGKPVIGQKKYKDLQDAPIWEAEQSNFKNRFLEFIDNQEKWEAIGKESKAYALRKHSPQAVARIASNVYKRILDEKRY